MTRLLTKNLELLKRKALHSLEEQKAKDKFQRALNAYYIEDEDQECDHTQEKIDALGDKCEKLRVEWRRCQDNNVNNDGERVPPISHYAALELVAKLIDFFHLKGNEIKWPTTI